MVRKPGEVVRVDVGIPEPPAGFARIKVKAAAICATDLEIMDGNIQANYPVIPGHEWSGVVDAVGSPEDERWIGRRVIGSNDVVCLKCDACRSGKWRYCKHFEEIGFKRNGAYAEYVIVPAYDLYEIADSLPFENAALCEPLGVALGTFEKTGARLGDTCVIIGAGSIGLCMLAVAKAMGLRRIIVAASSRRRLKIAEQMGAYATVATREEDLQEVVRRLHPDGTDVVIEATGIEECIAMSLKLPKKGGAVALAGYGRGKMMTLRIDDIHLNNLRVYGSGYNWNVHKKAARLMEDGVIDLTPFITMRITLDEFEKGIQAARTRPEGFVKALYIFD